MDIEPAVATYDSFRVREVRPINHYSTNNERAWKNSAEEIHEQELSRSASERTDAFYFDLIGLSELLKTSESGFVKLAIVWVNTYISKLNTAFPNEWPPAFFVLASGLRRRDRTQLLKYDVQTINPAKRPYTVLLGQGSHAEQMENLVRNLLGSPSNVFPLPPPSPSVIQSASSQPPLSQPGSGPSTGWDLYTKAPSHIDRNDVAQLFEKLAGDQDIWERDF
jgi:hypothetical protein